jgi:hypothetical protein
MDSTIIVALILGLCGILGNFLQSRSNSRKIEEIHLSINSRMDALLKAAEALARLEGRNAGMQEQKEKR